MKYKRSIFGQIFGMACLLAFFGCNSSDGIEIGEPKLLLDAKAQLGEGAFWHEKSQRLFWIDIEGKQLHVSNTAEATDKAFQMGSRIGTVVPDSSGKKAVVALQVGIQCFDLETGGFSLLAHPQDSSDYIIRYNDGKADPQGNFWVGGMHLSQEKGAAQLYRIRPNGEWTSMLPSVTISNGIVWNESGTTMYYIDTPTMQIKAFPINPDGSLGNYKVAVTVPDSVGFPDGMAIDAEGKLWVGHWGGSCVARWDPETGKLLARIMLPAPNVTSCAFGGPELKTLYITTARVGLSEEQLAKFPQSGGIFSVETNVKGRLMATFDGCK